MSDAATNPHRPRVDEAALARVQRRIVRVLVASQVLGGVGVGAGIAVIALLAYDLSGTASLSGVSPTASTLGAGIAAVAIARFAVRAGRRTGLVVGYCVGAGGAVLAVVAAVLGSFPLHVVASFGFGWASASNLQARYAATDLATDDRRASALSTVVWATTLGAVLGPNLTGPGSIVAVAMGLPELAGPYVFSFVSFAGAALVQLVGLRPDPLLLARAARAAPDVAVEGPAAQGAPETVREVASAVPATSRVVGSAAGADEAAAERPVPPGQVVDEQGIRRSLTSVRHVPAALAGVVAISAAHGTMIGVMVMTPVHMENHGAALQLVGLTISLHIAGMYAFSPLVGRLADAIGRRAVLLLGTGQLALAVVLAATTDPTGSVPFQTALVLLGTGWSFCLIAGSTLLTEALPLEQRPGAQGASDLVMNLSGALGGTLAGIVLALWSYEVLAFGALFLLLAPTWLAARLPRRARATG